MEIGIEGCAFVEDIRSFNDGCSIIVRAVMLLSKPKTGTTDEIKPIEIAKLSRSITVILTFLISKSAWFSQRVGKLDSVLH